jgi:selenocysteine-specific elongation factor
MQHVVVGTAGHIDHGKSSLVLALTGTDPDRLREEKERGITIELGFAHTIEDGIALSFVDVPGHERFVRNMLAGVAGMDLVMLHVAADESVMPQTHEHFEICRLLRVPGGLVVVTKADLADPATLDVVRLEIQELVAGSFLDGAPVVAVSSRTGDGIPELRRTLASLASTVRRRSSAGPPRMPIDRVFSMKGFGTVVTGTLLTGRLSQDDELVLEPSGRVVKVRGIQVHGKGERAAVAGQRVAVNVAGAEVSDLTRGETLTVPGAVSVTRRVDVSFELLRTARPLAHGARVRFHQGARELLGRVAISGAATVEPGAPGFARVHLEAPAVLVRGDRFILRAYSPLETIAGGSVLDPLPPRRGVRTAAGIARFARLATSSSPLAAGTRVEGSGDVDAVMVMVEEAGVPGLPLGQIVGRAGVAVDARDSLIAELKRRGLAVSIGGVLVSAARLASVEEALVAAVGRYHSSHPLEEGIPREELRERLFPGAPIAVFEEVVRGLAARSVILDRDRVARVGHRVALTEQETRVRDAIVEAAKAGGFAPPDAAAVAAATGAQPGMFDRLATLLVRQGVLVRVGDLLFHQSALERLKQEIQSMKREGTIDTIDVATFKSRYSVTRKHAIPLLEYLDRERVTRRVGDVRKIL